MFAPGRWRTSLDRSRRLNMWAWFRQLFDRKRSAKVADAEEARARAELNRLRRDELSVGAHMRLGLPVTSAPGQIFSSAPSAGPDTSSARLGGTARADSSVPKGGLDASLVVSLATWSFAAGYGAGASIAGASNGDSIGEENPSAPSPSE